MLRGQLLKSFYCRHCRFCNPPRRVSESFVRVSYGWPLTIKGAVTDHVYVVIVQVNANCTTVPSSSLSEYLMFNLDSFQLSSPKAICCLPQEVGIGGPQLGMLKTRCSTQWSATGQDVADHLPVKRGGRDESQNQLGTTCYLTLNQGYS